jgi:predicted TIM-barrel fold metal-dependent hydrolase
MQSPLSKPPHRSPTSVDTHWHVFEAGQSVPGARYTPAYTAPFAAWRALAASVGVTHGVLVQTSFMGADNRLLLGQLAQHPDTLRAVAVVAPEASPALLSSLHAQGVRGIRLNLAGGPHAMAGWADAQALWDAVSQLGWHVELHTDTGALPPVLAALPVALPLVLDHFAKPAQARLHDATVAAVGQRQRRSGAGGVHVKLSAAYRLGPGADPSALAHLWLDELGPQALLWGSDWPCTNHEPRADYPTLHAALADWLGGDPALLQQVRCVNPMRLYWREPGV